MRSMKADMASRWGCCYLAVQRFSIPRGRSVRSSTRSNLACLLIRMGDWLVGAQRSRWAPGLFAQPPLADPVDGETATSTSFLAFAESLSVSEIYCAQASSEPRSPHHHPHPHQHQHHHPLFSLQLTQVAPSVELFLLAFVRLALSGDSSSKRHGVLSGSTAKG